MNLDWFWMELSPDGDGIEGNSALSLLALDANSLRKRFFWIRKT
ncbi:hypothetical protein FHS69_002392 [Erythrobacter flavus]|nr:hypothetical protein [Qipengyuania flava]